MAAEPEGLILLVFNHLSLERSQLAFWSLFLHLTE